MDKIFQYAILQYHYSQSMGEVMNLGIAFYFGDGTVHFKHPSNLNRIRDAYNVNTRYLERVLTSFKTCEINSESIKACKSLDEILTEFYLRPDAFSLQFAPARKIVKWNSSNDVMMHGIFQTYFPNDLWENRF